MVDPETADAHGARPVPEPGGAREVSGDHGPGAGNDLLTGLLGAVDAGAYAVDGGGLILAVNPATEELLGRPAKALIGRDAHDLLHRDRHGQTLPRTQCPMMHALLARRTVQESPGWFERGDGSPLPVSWLVTPFRLDDGTSGALVVFHPHGDAPDPYAWEERPVPSALTEMERLALLAETTTRLTSTLDADQALNRLVRIVLPRLGDWAIVDLITENDEVRRTAVVQYADGVFVERRDLQGSLPPVPQESPLPLSRALRGAASTLATPDTYAGRPDSGLAVEQGRLFKATGMHSAVIAPIRGPREVLGALTLGRAGRTRPFTADDLPLVEDITRRAGVALDNARLYQQQRRVAETMQRHLLPKLPRLPGLEMTARYVPAPDASQVGGDWYDVFPLRDGATALVIGDVVGHDLDAAAGMAQLRNMLRADAWSRREPPGTVMGRLDETVTYLAEVPMATVVFGRLEGDRDSGWRLRWTNAGHPPPLLIDHDGRARFLTEAHGILLGTGSAAARPDAEVDLGPRSTLVLYTDGLIESPDRSIDDGLATLRHHAANLAHRPLESFCDLLLERVRPPGNDDDVAILALRVPPAGPRVA
ncbi:SpoIIE family protein phosphatase [Actinacidiphila acididurans]|uniref:SpoIIE family protein phosphatase n=1 Tax=Actinacidiphila acididurans TaxID=2784346 RepID=A0ABS2TSQ1_9ACTN|nr:SpoIIE family protein phosphatase [Actinacidiphila acididurans]MBM9506365.1 SpoIIE family protein phosphatase [Actinacidiphila acididurans]